MVTWGEKVSKGNYVVYNKPSDITDSVYKKVVSEHKGLSGELEGLSEIQRKAFVATVSLLEDSGGFVFDIADPSEVYGKIKNVICSYPGSEMENHFRGSVFEAYGVIDYFFTAHCDYYMRNIYSKLPKEVQDLISELDSQSKVFVSTVMSHFEKKKIEVLPGDMEYIIMCAHNPSVGTGDVDSIINDILKNRDINYTTLRNAMECKRIRDEAKKDPDTD